jgi:uncharacterized repeat protein (TIGR01451 family)
MINHLHTSSLPSQSAHKPGLLKVLAASLVLLALGLPMVAGAQSAACPAGQTLGTFNFAAPNPWPAGGANMAYGIGTGASALRITATADRTLSVNDAAGTATPNTQTTGATTIGGFPISTGMYYLVQRTAATINTPQLAVFTFNKPINNLQFVVTDLDSNQIAPVNPNPSAGGYVDQATVTAVGVGGGAVLPSSVTVIDATQVTIAGNVVTSAKTPAQGSATVGGVPNAQNCPQVATAGMAAPNACNATFNFSVPITSFTVAYTAGPGSFGVPPAQVIGISGLAYCVQNSDVTLTKDDAGASFSAGTTGTYSFVVTNPGAGPTLDPASTQVAVNPNVTPVVLGAATILPLTVKDVLPLGLSFGTPLTPTGTNAANWTCVVSTTTNANDTATCTSIMPIPGAGGTSTFSLPVVVAATAPVGTTITNRAKVYGGGDPNKVAETTTGTIAACPSDGLAGAVANAGCGFETTPIIASASLVITKTDNKTIATTGGTNNYVMTLTNQGPSPASGVVVTDAVGAGLTCPSTNPVTCSVTGAGAVCPTGPFTIANLTGAGITVATLPLNGALQFAYSCNVN